MSIVQSPLFEGLSDKEYISFELPSVKRELKSLKKNI